MTTTDKLAQALRKLRDAFLGTSIVVQGEAMRAAHAALAEYDSAPSAPAAVREDEEAYLYCEAEINRLRAAVVVARDGYISERATGRPVLEAWRERTLSILDEALGPIGRKD